MKIEEGKYYRRRDGEVVGPAMLEWIGHNEAWSVGGRFYPDSGKYFGRYRKSSCDLIEECMPDGTPVKCNPDGSPIMDNHAVLEKAMREGLCVKKSYWDVDTGEKVAVLAINGDVFWDGTNTWGVYEKHGWQIVEPEPAPEPEITALDLCEAIDAIGGHEHSHKVQQAKELADKYRKQQEKN